MLRKKARFLKVLGDETKLKILQSLLDEEVCSCHFIRITGRAQSTVSTHLRDLEREGILQSRRQGRNIFYRISDPRVYALFTLLGITRRKKTSARNRWDNVKKRIL
ncbi:transcriptional regulator [Candidatus Woesearchaeota archaeon]|nr:MAG: transcriptional regulator [Candidatus Woesearchaeota archaeon]